MHPRSYARHLPLFAWYGIIAFALWYFGLAPLLSHIGEPNACEQNAVIHPAEAYLCHPAPDDSNVVYVYVPQPQVQVLRRPLSECLTSSPRMIPNDGTC